MAKAARRLRRRPQISRRQARPPPSHEPQPTFATLANSKNKVYFMWNSIGRTLDNIQLNMEEVTSLESLSAVQQALFEDVIQRSVLASSLILDTNPSMLNNLIEQTNPEAAGHHSESGDEIEGEVKTLSNVGK
ncbi:hypothetical protein M409DRAFT_15952 [Zasmidium cellare ATCC 36951]|uniref:Uncharacterized protein n=1 Tax=Zasmidium cellare ATCC 36951 TaxID=1080233 RepID=A0A6A6D3P3_ZASCE|nr:uncharacterized protein M409DRAFT_15952 [Zasmidium cellare ATCC 36951]KAF2173675.1 hypothetical protein M409DRAFT_15952 [Zasmidium cellare ATCC 36951]